MHAKEAREIVEDFAKNYVPKRREKLMAEIRKKAQNGYNVLYFSEYWVDPDDYGYLKLLGYTVEEPKYESVQSLQGIQQQAYPTIYNPYWYPSQINQGITYIEGKIEW
jgi:hypothetical protein